MRRASAGVSLVQARLKRTLDGRRRMAEAAALLPAVLSEVVAAGTTGAEGWVLRTAHLSGTQVAVLMVGPEGEAPAAVVKVPSTPGGVASQRREAAAVAGLLAEPGLGDLARLVPRRLAEGEVGGVAYTVEQAVTGVEGRVLLGYPSMRPRVVAAAAAVAGALHEATAEATVVDASLLKAWVGDRVRLLEPATRNEVGLERLERQLRRAWEGRDVTVSWVHGDFWPANVIFDAGAEAGTEVVGEAEALSVAGVIDWEWAAAWELPAQDVLYLLLHMRMLDQSRELGPVVASLLSGEAFGTAEQDLLEEAGVTPNRETLLLVWLRHVAYNLIQAPGEARNWIWTSRNVDTVLRSV